MNFEIQEMMETIRMVRMENLDIRTVTMGINLRDCADSDFDKMNQKIYDKITHYAKDLKTTAEKVEKEYGIPIINKRIADDPNCRSSWQCNKRSSSGTCQNIRPCCCNPRR